MPCIPLALLQLVQLGRLLGQRVLKLVHALGDCVGDIYASIGNQPDAEEGDADASDQREEVSAPHARLLLAGITERCGCSAPAVPQSRLASSTAGHLNLERALPARSGPMACLRAGVAARKS